MSIAQHHRGIVVGLWRNKVVNTITIQAIFKIVESFATEVFMVIICHALRIGRNSSLDVTQNRHRCRTGFYNAQDSDSPAASSLAKVSISTLGRNRIGKFTFYSRSPAKIERTCGSVPSRRYSRRKAFYRSPIGILNRKSKRHNGITLHDNLARTSCPLFHDCGRLRRVVANKRNIGHRELALVAVQPKS